MNVVGMVYGDKSDDGTNTPHPFHITAKHSYIIPYHYPYSIINPIGDEVDAWRVCHVTTPSPNIINLLT